MQTKYSRLSISAKAKLIDRIRRNRLRYNLSIGKVPTLRNYLVGAEEIYKEFGIIPNVDVFVPRLNFPKELELKARRRFKYDKYTKPYAYNGLSDLNNTIRRINDQNLKDDLMHRNNR